MEVRQALSGAVRFAQRWLGPSVSLQELKEAGDDRLLEAQAETAKTIAKLMLTLLGFGAFCVLALGSPDSHLIGGTASLNVPFAGHVDFQTFLFVGPAILFGLRLYLQIYVGHWRRLEAAISESAAKARAPTVSPMRHPLLRLFSGFMLYLLVPLVIADFAWKGAGLPGWGAGLAIAAVAIIVVHLWLLARQAPARWKLLHGTANGLAVVLVLASVSLVASMPEVFRRPLDLFRADLRNQWLMNVDFTGADLERANLTESYLIYANLTGADLNYANLAGANLSYADLTDANLSGANLTGANLDYADLLHTGFLDADLRSAKGLDCDRLVEAELWAHAYRSPDLACGASIPSSPDE